MELCGQKNDLGTELPLQLKKGADFVPGSWDLVEQDWAMDQEQRQPIIFFVDDDSSLRQIIELTFSSLPYQVTCFADGIQCLKALENQECDLLITDVKMPHLNGLELMARFKTVHPSVPVLILTGFGDIPLAVKATRSGAFDFIEKPVSMRSLVSVVEKALTLDSLVNSTPALTAPEIRMLKLIADGKCDFEIATILGGSIRAMEEQRNHLMKILNVNNSAELVRKAIILGRVYSW